MALVAYDASSSDESNDEDEAVEVKLMPQNVHKQSAITNGHISDDDEDDWISTNTSASEHKKSFLTLPQPKNTNDDYGANVGDLDSITSSFKRLPAPKATPQTNDSIIEEDDEFLHKKPSAEIVKCEETKISKPEPISSSRKKITIPSLKDFVDVDRDLAEKKNKLATNHTSSKGSSLLCLLPKAKSEQNFSVQKQDADHKTEIVKGNKATPSFIPDSVKLRRPAHNTENVDNLISKKGKNPPKQELAKLSLVDCSDSEASDEDAGEPGDFFCLNDEEKLPEVNLNEINALVAKRAAKMADAASKYLEKSAPAMDSEADLETDNMNKPQKRISEQQYQLNDEAMNALVGSSAKRRRKHQANEFEIKDISSDQVLPSHDEWMRTALTSSTAYQPTGVLVDEEPAAGTRRKHQITYLAHKAKANEVELQAMWSANRQNRRAAQSKYGF